jgi:GrpB-like predicted nucleotidyltransferase (UPF0157 family)
MSREEVHAGAKASQRATDLLSFLETRDLTVEDLTSAARTRMGPGEVHIVSTAVQGLAGSTSDIDMIVVSPAALDTSARMSMMTFVKGSRVGIKCYSRDEIAESLRHLAAVSELPAGDLQRELDGWRAPVPWVDLERLINGLRYDMTCPFEWALGDLCAARFSQGFGLFREGVICGCLAQRAGEQRSPWGYLLFALPHLMAAVLACEGSVIANAKWTTQRWSVSRAARRQEWRILNEWWDRAWTSLSRQADPPQVDELLDLYDRSASTLGIALQEDDRPLSWRADMATAAFGEGVHLTRDERGRIVLHGVAELNRDPTLQHLCRLNQCEAQAMLAFVRADFVEVKLRASALAHRGKALYRGQAA